MDADSLRLDNPCPVELDQADFVGTKRHFCDHCSKDVHVLSNMSEEEARELLRSVAGQNVCVSYHRRADGSVVFQEPPRPVALADVVPLHRLTRRRPGFSASVRRAAVAASMAAAVAGCTPHGETAQSIEVDEVPAQMAGGMVVVPPVEVEPEPVMELGEIEAILEPPVPFAGGIKAPPVDPPPAQHRVGELAAPDPAPVEVLRGDMAVDEEPCDPPKPKVKRGGLRRQRL